MSGERGSVFALNPMIKEKSLLNAIYRVLPLYFQLGIVYEMILSLMVVKDGL